MGLRKRSPRTRKETCTRLTSEIAAAPAKLRAAIDGMSDAERNTRYRNWSARQIVNHLADSHMHSLIRFRWALTESTPTIKAYDEAAWVALADCTHGSLEPPLALFEGVHAKWVQLLESMTEEAFRREFYHPELKETVALWSALHYYAWHARHHTGHPLASRTS